MASSISALRKLGVTFQVLKALSFENLCARMTGKDGVMMIRLVGSKGGAAHRVILERVGGVVKILDRYGEFANLELLSKHYSSVLNGGKFIVDAAADAVYIPQVTALLVKGVPTLMVAANALVRLADDTSVAALDDKFERFKNQRGGSNVIHLSPPPHVTVAHGDTLSALARKYYGSVEYWPLIWDVNKDTVGPNPNRITPGMTLAMPALSAFGEREKADARRRHSTWKNY
jgi:LysM repeat protein